MNGVQGTALYELYLCVRQRAVLALSQLDKVDHSKEVCTMFLDLYNFGQKKQKYFFIINWFSKMFQNVRMLLNVM